MDEIKPQPRWHDGIPYCEGCKLKPTCGGAAQWVCRDAIRAAQAEIDRLKKENADLKAQIEVIIGDCGGHEFSRLPPQD